MDRRERTPLTGLDVPAWLGHFAALEQGASRLCTYEPFVVPGLLQTRDYAAAVQRSEIVPPSHEEVERWVQVRMARQAVLTRPDPLVLRAVIDESVLHRIAGDCAVMQAQLAHLMAVAARPNVDLRVLTLDASVFVAVFGSFTVLTSKGSTRPYMACLEDRDGTRYLDRPSDVATYSELFDPLHAVSLPAGDLITATAKERYA